MLTCKRRNCYFCFFFPFYVVCTASNPNVVRRKHEKRKFWFWRVVIALKENRVDILNKKHVWKDQTLVHIKFINTYTQVCKRNLTLNEYLLAIDISSLFTHKHTYTLSLSLSSAHTTTTYTHTHARRYMLSLLYLSTWGLSGKYPAIRYERKYCPSRLMLLLSPKAFSHLSLWSFKILATVYQGRSRDPHQLFYPLSGIWWC